MIRLLGTFALLMAFALPARAAIDIKEVISPGGIRAWLVEDHGIPFTALEIRFRGGTAIDPAGKRGAVNLMAALLEEGTGDLDSQGFSEARDALAAQFSFGARADSVRVSAQFLTENRDAAVDLLRGAITQPNFAEDDLNRVRGQVLSNIASNLKDPGTLVWNRFDELAYGDHPYATDGDGTAESVAALTRDDIVAAHRGAMARDRVFVAATGDITAAELGALLDLLLGDLPETGADLPGKAPWNLTGGVTVVDFPTPQSTVAFGQPGIRRDDPDFFAAFVMNEILGGGRFTARLMTEVRDKRGLTYGIGSSLSNLDQSQSFVGQFASGNGSVAEAIEVVRAEWARMAAEGATEEEVEAAKTYMTGAYPLQFDGNRQIAGILVSMMFDDFPIDYARTRNEKVAAVTVADVARVARRLVQPDQLHFVVVGQPEGLAPTP